MGRNDGERVLAFKDGTLTFKRKSVRTLENISLKAPVVLPERGDEECTEEAIGTCPEECIAWEDLSTAISKAGERMVGVRIDTL